MNDDTTRKCGATLEYRSFGSEVRHACSLTEGHEGAHTCRDGRTSWAVGALSPAAAWAELMIDRWDPDSPLGHLEARVAALEAKSGPGTTGGDRA